MSGGMSGFNPSGYISAAFTQDRARNTRRMRRPTYPFHLRVRPFQIVPCMIAPVIPGESIDHFLLQARVVTDPIKSPLIGWWCEYYFFYVKIRDLVERVKAEKVLLDIAYDPLADGLAEAAASTDYYKTANSINWVKKCLERCIDAYFRVDGEATDMGLIGNYHRASINQTNWLQSAMDETTITFDTGTNVDLNADTTITTAEIRTAMQTYEWLRLYQATTLSFDEYLAASGIKVPTEELHRPLLLRYVKEWQYPSNTVEPTTGVPSSAVSWSIADRADKKRFIKEPGFVIGLTVVRPKVYLSNQVGTASMMLKNVLSWLPAPMQGDPMTSLQKMDNLNTTLAGGPLGVTPTNDYYVDIKDLFLYGEQFTNVSPIDGTMNGVALPGANLDDRYPSSAMVDGLFKAAAPANQIRMDGIVSFGIDSLIVDTTPQTVKLAHP